MSEAHTADLGTRYRYRREGAELERQRIIELLERDLDVLPEFARAIELIKGEQK